MLRQLKHGQASGSVFSSLKPRLKQKHSPEEREDGVSFTSLPDLYTGLGLGGIALDSSTTTKQAKEGNNAVPFCSDAGSDHGGLECGKLERATSFEAWLSPEKNRIQEPHLQAKQGSSCSLPGKLTSVLNPEFLLFLSTTRMILKCIFLSVFAACRYLCGYAFVCMWLENC
jgi:hypothetical protein